MSLCNLISIQCPSTWIAIPPLEKGNKDKEDQREADLEAEDASLWAEADDNRRQAEEKVAFLWAQADEDRRQADAEEAFLSAQADEERRESEAEEASLWAHFDDWVWDDALLQQLP